MKIVVWNILGRRFDYKRTWSKRRASVTAAIKAVAPDIAILTECASAEAKELATPLGMHSVSYRGTSILYKGFTKGHTWTNSWLGNTHGALTVELSKGGKTYNVCSNHLPSGIFRATLRKRNMAALTGRMVNWNDPTIIAGDFNWRTTLEPFMKSKGYASARISAVAKKHANFRTNGAYKAGSQLDYLFGRKVSFLTYDVIPGTNKTDHHMLVIEVSE